MPTFEYRSHIAAPADAVFAWHTRPGAFQRLIPPWESIEVLEQTGGVENGSTVTLKVGSFPFRTTWIAEHRDFVPGYQFRDVQVSGPFSRWEHSHRVEAVGGGACRLHDHITYALPGLGLADLFIGRKLRLRLHRMFVYRHMVTAEDVAAHLMYKDKPRLTIAMTGASGLVGKQLSAFLTTGGHKVIRLVRGEPKPGEVQWDIDTGVANPEALEGIDAVIHLAGENIAEGRWTEAKKTRIFESRVKGTRTLVDAIMNLKSKPKTFITASAVGFYGDRGQEIMTEFSRVGDGFLADVCREWEGACMPAQDAGIRVVNVRLGMVLTLAGGALAKMITPFRFGAGGVMGNGEQFWSWVTIEDAIGAFHHVLMNEGVTGPVNAVAPDAATCHDFTKLLGRVLHRPTVFPMPAMVANMVFGEMADALLMASVRVDPMRLTETGYQFRHPDLESALRHMLGLT
ncbi:MAG: TIGR01777 family oxidoreductase [Planctomycetes bacterium]|nr:TIGR01777 family oxidoreductase [Planctomycetota bacterium]